MALLNEAAQTPQQNTKAINARADRSYLTPRAIEKEKFMQELQENGWRSIFI